MSLNENILVRFLSILSLVTLIFADEIEDSFEDVNTTAFNIRKNLIDPMLDYTRRDKTNESMDTRGRAIFTQSEDGLDLVFVLDASSSVKRENFELALAFVKKLVTFITLNGTRYCFFFRLFCNCIIHIISSPFSPYLAYCKQVQR